MAAKCTLIEAYTINGELNGIDVITSIVYPNIDDTEKEKNELIVKLHTDHCDLAKHCPYSLQECISTRLQIRVESRPCIIGKRKKRDQEQEPYSPSTVQKKMRKSVAPLELCCDICGANGTWCMEINFSEDSYPYGEILCCDTCDNISGNSALKLNEWLRNADACPHAKWSNVIGKIKAQCEQCGILSVGEYQCPVCHRKLKNKNGCSCDRCTSCLYIKKDDHCNVCSDKGCTCEYGIRRCQCERCEDCNIASCNGDCFELQRNHYVDDEAEEEGDENEQEETDEGGEEGDNETDEE